MATWWPFLARFTMLLRIPDIRGRWITNCRVAELYPSNSQCLNLSQFYLVKYFVSTVLQKSLFYDVFLMLVISVNRDLLMLTPVPSWACHHGSLPIARNANSSPAPVVSPFAKLPHQGCPVSATTLFFTSSGLSTFSVPFSQSPGPLFCYRLVVPWVSAWSFPQFCS